MIEFVYLTRGSLILDYIKFAKILPNSKEWMEFIIKSRICEKKWNYIQISWPKLAGFVSRKEKIAPNEEVKDFLEFLYVLYKSLFLWKMFKT